MANDSGPEQKTTVPDVKPEPSHERRCVPEIAGSGHPDFRNEVDKAILLQPWQ